MSAHTQGVSPIMAVLQASFLSIPHFSWFLHLQQSDCPGPTGSSVNFSSSLVGSRLQRRLGYWQPPALLSVPLTCSGSTRISFLSILIRTFLAMDTATSGCERCSLCSH